MREGSGGTAEDTAEGRQQAVEVLHDGRWCSGQLDRWKHDHRGWVGYVWWSEAPGLTHVEWLAAERLRPATGSAGG